VKTWLAVISFILLSLAQSVSGQSSSIDELKTQLENLRVTEKTRLDNFNKAQKVGSDGLVQQDHTYFDEASFLKQLGLIGYYLATISLCISHPQPLCATSELGCG
jgi:hypothetical protein